MTRSVLPSSETSSYSLRLSLQCGNIQARRKKGRHPN